MYIYIYIYIYIYMYIYILIYIATPTGAELPRKILGLASPSIHPPEVPTVGSYGSWPLMN